MKPNLFFCINMQRAGNTLLGSILNQNPDITFTANSPLTEIIHQLHLIKNDFEIVQNFPHHKSINNLISKSFYSYAESFETKYVIDRSNWGTDGNLKYLDNYFDSEQKFLILYRKPIECLASLCKAYKWDKQRSKENADYFMSINGQIGGAIWQIENILKSNKKYLVITYEQILNNAKQAVDNIYNFFNLKKYNHKFTNLKQFEVQGIKYDDSVIGDVDFHTIRTNKIEKNNYDLESVLPKDIINKYKNYGVNFES